jgi:hypothetical protein
MKTDFRRRINHNRRIKKIAVTFGVTAWLFSLCLRFVAALGATGGVRAAFGAGRVVAATRAIAGHAGFVLGRFAAGGHQNSCGKNRSHNHHRFHFFLWLIF